jgi:Flp pilus assembly protein TadB
VRPADAGRGWRHAAKPSQTGGTFKDGSERAAMQEPQQAIRRSPDQRAILCVLAEVVTRIVPLRYVRIGAAVVFALIGIWVLLTIGG